MKILGIDDNTDITELLDTVLNGSGHEYTFVNDGKSGVKKIKENQYDLVLLDLAMPGFSGEDVLAELNKEELSRLENISLTIQHTSLTSSDVIKPDALTAIQQIRRLIQSPVKFDDDVYSFNKYDEIKEKVTQVSNLLN